MLVTSGIGFGRVLDTSTLVWYLCLTAYHVYTFYFILVEILHIIILVLVLHDLIVYGAALREVWLVGGTLAEEYVHIISRGRKVQDLFKIGENP
ncbi:hypothetical protein SLEP1_g19516 [Rubroshorea leprosula]|uniref:Uncharacterized protein n=1 Tax=Rubroshorea leprosula TaxID=152421 RepID=A0AAV5JBH4_9ROSI|nr:hypothetical protein SLEP1_g19516 [Rubroshorea leprosula]